MTRFAAVRNLFAGSSLASPNEEDEDTNAGAAPTPPAAPKNAGPTAAQVDKVVSEEVTNAVAAERARCVAVISSDAGAANPKAAAKLLGMAGGSATAEEIVASLEEMGPGKTATDTAPPSKDDEPNGKNVLDTKRQKLAGNANANPDTGGAGNRPGDRKGEGEASASAEARRAERSARAEKRNKGVVGGVKAGS